MTNNDDIFVPLEQFPGYFISSNGNIYSEKSSKRLMININRFRENKRYIMVDLYGGDGKKKTVSLSRLVATTFVPNPHNKREVHHKNNNKYDNRASNLTWVSRAENAQYISPGIKKMNKPVLQYDKNGKLLNQFFSIIEASNKTGINKASISGCARGKNKTAGGFCWKFKKSPIIEGEQWKSIILEGEDSGYQVSNLGNVRNKHHSPIKGSIKEGGYITITLRYPRNKVHRFLLHRLVATYFITNKNNLPYVDHIDTNKQNNQSCNLRWCTMSENMKNVNTYSASLVSVQQIDNCNNVINTFPSVKDAQEYMGEEYNLPSINICNACRGGQKTAGGFFWKYIK